MANPARFLGFAFANADLLFEIDRDATVVFATGAVSEFVPGKDAQIVGRGVARLFEPSDGVKFVTYAKALGDGGRAGPLQLKLIGGKQVAVSLCHLPQNGANISCTLTRPGSRQGFGQGSPDPKTGLPRKDGFLAAASEIADGKSAMTLVDVPGLPDACAKLPADQADHLLQRIGELVQAAGPKAAGRLSDSTFGAVGDAGKPSNLASSIKAALKEGGLENSRVAETLVSLAARGLGPEQRLLALRHVVGRFAEGKHDAKAGEDLVSVFDTMVSDTQTKALALTDMVLQGNFSLAYQPVINLATNKQSHCEALARFEGPDSTGETVAFAEALGISDAFDVAVTAKLLDEVGRKPNIRVALNISGSTLSSPSTFGLISGFLATKRSLAPRVLIEITETAQINDVAMANQAVQALRALGYKVGLDDFGAGAASFQYLHAFEIDFVKFDAKLIRNLGKAPREDMLIAGLVKLCGELGIETIAEGIEDAEILKQVRAMGFEFGQGYHLGKPAAEATEIAAATPSAARSARRKGEQVAWG